MARDSKGHELPLQIDARSSHPDGSLRFAVFTTEIPDMAVGEHRIVSLLRGTPHASLPATAPSPAIGELRVELDLRNPQITTVTLGDRVEYKPGIPFERGETVTLHLGPEPAESFTVPIDSNLAGGNFDNYTRLAEAFVAQINSTSKAYRAFKGPDSYEHFSITTNDGHDKPFDVAFSYGGRAKITSIQEQAFRPSERYTATKRPNDGIAPAATWLGGPLAVEHDYLVPLKAEKGGASHPHLAVRLHWRTYPHSGADRIDTIVENDWAYVPGPQNWTYAVAIYRDGTEVYRRASVTHYHHARWHSLVWSTGRTEPDIRHDTHYLLRSGIVPHYGERLSIPENVIADQLSAVNKSDTRPMGTATVTPYMPMTGARADIGPLPQWAVLYLLTMDPRQRAVLFANADAGASIPMHYRDGLTDQPATLKEHPGMTTQFGKPSAKDAFPRLSNNVTPWTPEVAHHPSLFFVPYLMTGDLFYLEEQLFWTNWIIASVDPNFRLGGTGLLKANQLRAQAWSLRTLGEAAAITPDSHQQKTYLNAILANNLDWYIDRYPRNRDTAAVSPLSAIDLGEAMFKAGQASPWQQDFLFLAVGHLAELGVPKAEEFARWLAKFTVGRWINDASGFCHRMAPAYYINIRKKTDGALIADWATLFRQNKEAWNPDAGCPDAFPFGFPDSPSGYIANSYAMLGLATDFNIPGARDAFLRLANEAPGMIAKFAEDPTFDIVPSQ